MGEKGERLQLQTRVVHHSSSEPEQRLALASGDESSVLLRNLRIKR